MGTPDNQTYLPGPNKPEPINMFTSPINMVAIYTVLTILVKMQNSLGLEAMIEYIAKYLSTIERHHPEMKKAVAQALTLMSVEKIYRETTSSGKNS